MPAIFPHDTSAINIVEELLPAPPLPMEGRARLECARDGMNEFMASDLMSSLPNRRVSVSMVLPMSARIWRHDKPNRRLVRRLQKLVGVDNELLVLWCRRGRDIHYAVVERLTTIDATSALMDTLREWLARDVAETRRRIDFSNE